MAGEVNDTNSAAVVPESGMIHESNQAALRRKTNIADPSSTLIKHVAHGILDAAVALEVMHNCQLARLIPISPANVRKHFARRASCNRRARQHAIHGFQLRVMTSAQHESE